MIAFYPLFLPSIDLNAHNNTCPAGYSRIYDLNSEKLFPDLIDPIFRILSNKIEEAVK